MKNLWVSIGIAILIIGGIYVIRRFITGTPTMNNGVTVEVLEEGSGREARTGDTVSVHYVGTLADETKFDSSRDRGQPFSFTLGAGRVIPGWERGVLGMKVGETRRLTVPPELGYGATGYGPIPPNATLIFEIELLETR